MDLDDSDPDEELYAPEDGRRQPTSRETARQAGLRQELLEEVVDQTFQLQPTIRGAATATVVDQTLQLQPSIRNATTATAADQFGELQPTIRNATTAMAADQIGELQPAIRNATTAMAAGQFGELQPTIRNATTATAADQFGELQPTIRNATTATAADQVGELQPTIRNATTATTADQFGELQPTIRNATTATTADQFGELQPTIRNATTATAADQFGELQPTIRNATTATAADQFSELTPTIRDATGAVMLERVSEMDLKLEQKLDERIDSILNSDRTKQRIVKKVDTVIDSARIKPHDALSTEIDPPPSHVDDAREISMPRQRLDERRSQSSAIQADHQTPIPTIENEDHDMPGSTTEQFADLQAEMAKMTAMMQKLMEENRSLRAERDARTTEPTPVEPSRMPSVQPYDSGDQTPRASHQQREASAPYVPETPSWMGSRSPEPYYGGVQQDTQTLRYGTAAPLSHAVPQEYATAPQSGQRDSAHQQGRPEPAYGFNPMHVQNRSNISAYVGEAQLGVDRSSMRPQPLYSTLGGNRNDVVDLRHETPRTDITFKAGYAIETNLNKDSSEIKGRTLRGVFEDPPRKPDNRNYEGEIVGTKRFFIAEGSDVADHMAFIQPGTQADMVLAGRNVAPGSEVHLQPGGWRRAIGHDGQEFTYVSGSGAKLDLNYADYSNLSPQQRENVVWRAQQGARAKINSTYEPKVGTSIDQLAHKLSSTDKAELRRTSWGAAVIDKAGREAAERSGNRLQAVSHTPALVQYGRNSIAPQHGYTPNSYGPTMPAYVSYANAPNQHNVTQPGYGGFGNASEQPQYTQQSNESREYGRGPYGGHTPGYAQTVPNTPAHEGASQHRSSPYDARPNEGRQYANGR